MRLAEVLGAVNVREMRRVGCEPNRGRIWGYAPRLSWYFGIFGFLANFCEKSLFEFGAVMGATVTGTENEFECQEFGIVSLSNMYTNPFSHSIQHSLYKRIGRAYVGEMHKPPFSKLLFESKWQLRAPIIEIVFEMGQPYKGPFISDSNKYSSPPISTFEFPFESLRTHVRHSHARHARHTLECSKNHSVCSNTPSQFSA